MHTRVAPQVLALVAMMIPFALLACSDSDADSGSSADGGGTDADGGSGTGGSGGTGGTGGTGGDTSSDAGRTDSATTPGARPHPLYPALDLDTLPGDGGAQSGAYEPPTLPTTTREVTVAGTGAAARTELLDACQTAGTAVTVPNAAGRVGVLDFGNVEDCDVTLGDDVIADLVYVGHLPGPMVAPAHRIRIRGGQIGSIMVDPGSSDIVFDGVTVNNAVLPLAQRSGTGIYLMNDGAEHVDRFAFVNSVLRMEPTAADPAGNMDGCAYLAGGARNVFFANDNVVTAGNRNSWGFRIGGGDNFLIVDSTVRVSFHKLIRMNDGSVDYVYVKGGLWMREDTSTVGGDNLNDSFAQLGDMGTDQVFIHDTEVHLLSAQTVSFGAWNGPGQTGKAWEARRIAWHAVADSVVSDTVLGNAESNCAAGATCDYGLGTHSYSYDANLVLPTDAWRDLPMLAEDDPDALPIAP